jgi:membrane associated rhomboid family serine protease
MTQRPSSERRPAGAPIVAGSIIIGLMILCAGAGFALGSLAGIAVLAGLVGLFVGLVLGFVLVYDRYRDL